MNDFFNCQHKHDSSLLLRYRIEPYGCLAVVDTTQISDLLIPEQQKMLSWLNNEEKQYLHRFRFPKRYNEWLSGRIAAKCCLLQALQPAHSQQHPREFSILPDTHGRPVLSSRPTDNVANISISHSHRYAVAMSADRACGIDIQRISSQILRVQDRIASTREIELVKNLQPGDEEVGLTLLWTVKEAVKKHRLPDQPGIFQAVTIEQINPESKKNSWRAHYCLIGDKQSQPVHIVRLNSYMMAWCQG